MDISRRELLKKTTIGSAIVLAMAAKLSCKGSGSRPERHLKKLQDTLPIRGSLYWKRQYPGERIHIATVQPGYGFIPVGQLPSGEIVWVFRPRGGN
jgi:hypothetical protein